MLVFPFLFFVGITTSSPLALDKFIIPDFDSEKEIENAIIQGIEYFPKNMENREITVLGYYAYAQLTRSLRSKSPEHRKRAKVALKMLRKKITPGLFTTKKNKEDMAAPRIALGMTLKALRHIFSLKDADEVCQFTEEEKNKINEEVPTRFFFSMSIKKFMIFDVIAADVLGVGNPGMRETYDKLVGDSDFTMLCPGIDLVISRLKIRMDNPTGLPRIVS
jgi:hypothetical protein